MQNVNMAVKGNILTITIDLSQRNGRSASGKTINIASTHGNVAVPGSMKGETIGLNVYTKQD